jgi:hypothetical protein
MISKPNNEKTTKSLVREESLSVCLSTCNILFNRQLSGQEITS